MNAYYKLYIKSIIQLAATLLIKSSYTANSINTLLKYKGYTVDPDNPYGWKYYMNMAGVYHTSDTMMKITSLDTLEEIDFTVDNLKLHRGTRRAYVYGTSYYKELVNKYPSQQALINGILNPIDIGSAIAADDHKILFYDTTLVEPAEQHLIPGLQKYIDRFLGRWYNRDYTLFEPYFYPGLMAVLYSKLPPEIILLRKRARHTDMVHSFHVREYLSSFSSVGEEFDYMTQKLRLYLYRNIRYLNRNLGRIDTFNEITKKVLTDRGFSLVKYRLVQEYTDLDKQLTPNIEMLRETLNGIAPAQGGKTKTIGQILDQETPLARDNETYRTDTETEATGLMQHSLFNDLQTKVLESSVFDWSDSEPFTLTDVLLNHWIYLSHFGLYTTVIQFTNPSNGDVYKLSAKNAFIFYLYAYNRSIGVDLKTVPVVGAMHVRRIPFPTRDELKSMVDPAKVPDYYIDEILDTQVPITQYISVDAFREACQRIQSVMLLNRDMRLYNQDYIAEGQLNAIIDRCYMDIRIDLAGQITYDQWLSDIGIDVSTMGAVEFDTIAKKIVNLVTGADTSLTSSLKAIHASMLRIMTSLSSYSVQYLAEINDSPLKVLNMGFPRLTLPKLSNEDTIQVESPLPDILSLGIKETEYRQIPTNVPGLKITSTEQEATQHIPVSVDVRMTHATSTPYSVELVTPSVTLLTPDAFDLSTITDTTVSGYDAVAQYPLDGFISSSSLSGYELLTEERRKLFLGI